MLSSLLRACESLVAAKAAPRPTFRPSLARLEGRDCPAVSAVANAAGEVTARIDNSSAGQYGGQYLWVSRGFDLIAVNGSYVTKPNGQLLKVWEVTRLTIYGSARDNTIDLTAVTRDAFAGSRLNGNIYVYAGGGNDYVLGSAYADQIFGEGGNDWLYGREGNDAIQGGDGEDRVVGGKGNDVLWGGRGTDLFVGDDEVVSPDYVQPNYGRFDWVRDLDRSDYYLWTGGLNSRTSEFTRTRPAWDIEYGVPGKPGRPPGRSSDIYGFDVG